MRFNRRRISSVVALALLLTITSGNYSEAAAKPKLNKKNVSIEVGSSVTINVKNSVAKAKVSWKSSKTKVAKITKKVAKGKKAKAVVKGMKPGKSVITAIYKVGRKTSKLSCTVTVKDKKIVVTPETTAVVTQIPTLAPTPTPTAVPTATPEPSEEMKAFLETISIPYADEIRGNITLPETYNEATLSWKSSNTSVITDKDTDGKLAGVVTRGDSDQTVILTATVNWNGEIASKDITVNVLQAPAPLTDDDYEGYLFGHFIGEGAANQEQIYFALSESGLTFKDMNKSKPVLTSTVGEKGVRDPYLYRSPEGDRFFLIATDLSIFGRGGWRMNAQGYTDASTTGSHNLVLWQSTDLVNWGEPKLINVAPENAGMSWAPEMIYDDETGEYIIFFASSIMNPDTLRKDKPNAIYYVATRDFVNFSETRLFIDNQTDGSADNKQREIIDTTVIKIGDTYYSASKDGDNYEANGGIRIMKTKNLLDHESWEKVLDLDELGLNLSGLKLNKLDNSTLEGPELFRLNKKDWKDSNIPEYVLMADQYGVSGGYLPLATTNIEDLDNSLKSWKLLSSKEYSFDKLKKRHGTILPITKEELDRVSAAYPNN